MRANAEGDLPRVVDVSAPASTTAAGDASAASTALPWYERVWQAIEGAFR